MITKYASSLTRQLNTNLTMMQHFVLISSIPWLIPSSILKFNWMSQNLYSKSYWFLFKVVLLRKSSVYKMMRELQRYFRPCSDVIFCSYGYRSFVDFRTRRCLWIMRAVLLILTTEVVYCAMDDNLNMRCKCNELI